MSEPMNTNRPPEEQANYYFWLNYSKQSFNQQKYDHDYDCWKKCSKNINKYIKSIEPQKGNSVYVKTEGGYMIEDTAVYLSNRNRRISLRRAIIVIFAMIVIWGAGIWLMV
jgi:hypothetical protein